jgi:hypothetical protein
MKSISHIPSPSSPPTFYPPTSNPPPPTVPISQSCPLLFIPKSVFKGSSQCVPAMSILYFGPFNPFHCSPSSLPSHPHYSAAFSTHPYVLYLHKCDVLWYYWCSIILFSFPYYKHVLHLNMWSHLFLCIHLSLDLSSTYERKRGLFLSWLTSLNMMSSNCIHFPSNHMSFFLMAE